LKQKVKAKDYIYIAMFEECFVKNADKEKVRSKNKRQVELVNTKQHHKKNADRKMAFLFNGR